EPQQDRQGDARSGRGDRESEDAGLERGQRRGGGADHRGHGALDGRRGRRLEQDRFQVELGEEPVVAKHGKKFTQASKNVEQRPYNLTDAIAASKAASFAKFDETLEIAMRLGVDPKHA